GAPLAVDVYLRVVGTRGRVLLERVTHGLVLAEALQDLVGGPTESLEQDGDALLTLPVDADTDEVTLVDLELQPCTAGRDDLAAVQVLVRGLVHGSVEVHTRRSAERRGRRA